MSEATLESVQATLDDVLAQLRELEQRIAAPPVRFMTFDGAEAYSSLSKASLRRMVSMGQLTPHRAVKGRVLIDRHELDSVISSATGRVRRGRGIRDARPHVAVGKQ